MRHIHRINNVETILQQYLLMFFLFFSEYLIQECCISLILFFQVEPPKTLNVAPSFISRTTHRMEALSAVSYDSIGQCSLPHSELTTSQTPGTGKGLFQGM